MRLRVGVFPRYRPRVLTLAVLLVVGALVALANLSPELRDDQGKPISVREFDDASLGLKQLSYGWPLVWRRQVLYGYVGVPSHAVVALEYRASRLVGDLVVWALISAAAAVTCEWLPRRSRPRFRWSLRTLLAAVAAAAVLCSWFAAAHSRANLQDALIAAVNAREGCLRLERWGPKWIDLVGAGRYCRDVVGAEELRIQSKDAGAEELIRQLARLRRLSLLYFDIDSERLTSELIKPLGEMTGLKTLVIESRRGARQDETRLSHELFAAVGKISALERLELSTAIDGKSLSSLANLRNLKSLCLANCRSTSASEARRLSRECLAAIGRITSLEQFELAGMDVDSEDLARLAGLTKLKSLRLHNVINSSDFSVILDDFDSPPPPLLRRLPALPQLESLALESSYVDGRDLARLAILPRLKSLSLIDNHLSDVDLVSLARLKLLEELAFSDHVLSAAWLESLIENKQLKRLHLADVESDEFLRAVQALRRSKPELVIDDDINVHFVSDKPTLPAKYNIAVDDDSAWLVNGKLPWASPAWRSIISPKELAEVKW